jgi:hypothetical protein
MVSGQRILSHQRDVARHCRKRDIGEDGLPSEDAYLIRADRGESFLSTNWCEYFHLSDRQTQIDGVITSLRAKRTVRSGEFIVILNVGVAITSCASCLGVTLQFTVLGEPGDPSHTGIFGYTEVNNAGIALVLASSVNVCDVHRVQT